ncbi:MAG: response regulator [Dehalococcoidales bacterium]|nr:response regulator [Dehalococcoidales bacterium]
MDKKKGKLLIADDEPNIRLLIKKIFEKEYTVIEAENGKKAVDSALHNQPDIILMDIMMPETDGLTALSAMKADARTRSIPVIMLTGVGHELNEIMAKSMGAKGYMRKPINSQELLDIVNKLLKDR